MVIWGMVYYCYTHIIVYPLSEWNIHTCNISTHLKHAKMTEVVSSQLEKTHSKLPEDVATGDLL